MAVADWRGLNAGHSGAAAGSTSGPRDMTADRKPLVPVLVVARDGASVQPVVAMVECRGSESAMQHDQRQTERTRDIDAERARAARRLERQSAEQKRCASEERRAAGESARLEAEQLRRLAEEGRGTIASVVVRRSKCSGTSRKTAQGDGDGPGRGRTGTNGR